MIRFFPKENVFTFFTRFLVVILPFYVLIKVFFEHKLGIPKFGFFVKDFIIVILFFSFVYESYKRKKFPEFELVDGLIGVYFIYGIFITLFNGLGIESIIYGGRYDFVFFVVFLIYKHGYKFLEIKPKQLFVTFMYSASISLLLSVIVKFRIGEDVLLIFGFQDYVSNWTFRGGIPSYHGLESSGIRRFSGILDGPNTMGFFLILYSSVFLYLQKNKGEFYVYFYLIFLFILIILTYSRSALLGIMGAIGILVLTNAKFFYKYYKRLCVVGIMILILFIGITGYVFEDKVKSMVVRTSSTKGHFERMGIGIKRFIEKPFGSGLGESGPAYRSIYKGEITKERESYYIPESWFIQQLVEGGFIYLLLFLCILGSIGKKLYQKSYIFFGLFVAIIIMNVFLHTFEATYLSILLFLFIALIGNKKS